ncbi:MAG: transcriptional regulator [Promethearchaeota archaeon]|nr:MAG: transcriptional regulator [Candidatus Lokiarchaeota archaeon]
MDDSVIWETKRERLIRILKDNQVSIDLRSIMKEFEYPSKKSLIRDITSIAKTLKNDDLRLIISPPLCNACGYVFRLKKDALKIPSKCPKCKQQRIEWPSIRLA